MRRSAYGRQISEAGPAQVAFILDGSDPTTVATSLSAAQLIGQSLATGVTEKQLQGLFTDSSLQLVHLEQVIPSLEDVFLTLAEKQ